MSTRRGRERGAMLLIMAGLLTLFCIVALGTLTVMRVAVARQEVQNVADSACLTAAGIVRYEGLPFDVAKQSRAAAIALRTNPALGFQLTFGTTESPTSVDIQCNALLAVSAPMAVWNSGVVNVVASARGSVAQVTETQATRLYPNLVLVLDYSGSMMQNLGGKSSQSTSIGKLREEVNLLLDNSATLKLGLVIFGSGVLDSSPVAMDSAAAIRTKVKASPKGCPEGQSTDCLTNSSAALAKARSILQASGNPDESKYVLFVSDGAPTMPDQTNFGADEDAAFTQATNLWNDGVTMLTLHIINVSDPATVAHLKSFMVRLSGYPEKRSDPSMYFNADSDSSLDNVFAGLNDAIGCPMTALDPPPADPSKLHVFVKSGAGEIPVGNAATVNPHMVRGDLTDHNGPFYSGDWFLYWPANHTIYLTKPVCSMVIDQGEPVVIRQSAGRLTQ